MVRGGQPLWLFFFFSWGVVLPRLFYSLTHLRSPLHTRNTHTHTRARARCSTAHSPHGEGAPKGCRPDAS